MSVILKFRRWLRRKFVSPAVDAIIVSLLEDCNSWKWHETELKYGAVQHASDRFCIYIDDAGYGVIRATRGNVVTLSLSGFESYCLGKAAKSWVSAYHQSVMNEIRGFVIRLNLQ